MIPSFVQSAKPSGKLRAMARGFPPPDPMEGRPRSVTIFASVFVLRHHVWSPRRRRRVAALSCRDWPDRWPPLRRPVPRWPVPWRWAGEPATGSTRGARRPAPCTAGSHCTGPVRIRLTFRRRCFRASSFCSTLSISWAHLRDPLTYATKRSVPHGCQAVLFSFMCWRDTRRARQRLR